MKIIYINGYKGTQSKKHHILNTALVPNIKFIQVDYETLNKKRYIQIDFEIKQADVIIASSTGSYLARKLCEDYNKILISYNPVVDLEKTFQKLNAKMPKLPKPNFFSINELIFVNKDDNLIDYKETLKIFSNKVKVYPSGGHRFSNIKDTLCSLQQFLMGKKIKNPLKLKYSKNIWAAVPCKKGIYFYYYKDELIYVGKATSSPNGSLCNRIKKHYSGQRGSDQFSLYIYDSYIKKTLDGIGATISKELNKLTREWARENLTFSYIVLEEDENESQRESELRRELQPKLNPLLME